MLPKFIKVEYVSRCRQCKEILDDPRDIADHKCKVHDPELDIVKFGLANARVRIEHATGTAIIKLPSGEYFQLPIENYRQEKESFPPPDADNENWGLGMTRGVLVCKRCRHTFTAASTEDVRYHDRWHDEMNKAMEEMEAKTVRNAIRIPLPRPDVKTLYQADIERVKQWVREYVEAKISAVMVECGLISPMPIPFGAPVVEKFDIDPKTGEPVAFVRNSWGLSWGKEHGVTKLTDWPHMHKERSHERTGGSPEGAGNPRAAGADPEPSPGTGGGTPQPDCEADRPRIVPIPDRPEAD